MVERNPTLEINRRDLEYALAALPEYREADKRNAFIRYLFEQSVKYRNNKRKIVGLNKTIIKKTNEILIDNIVNVEHFCSLLNSVRNINTYGNAKEIRKNSSNYRSFTEIAKIAYYYAESFQFDTVNEGLLEYITKCIEWMPGGYRHTKFLSLTDRIMEYGRKGMLIKQDLDPQMTGELCTIYEKKLYVLSNISFSKRNDYEYYYNFLLCQKCCKECSATPQQWLDAQFEAYPQSYPEPYQLFTDVAKSNYIKYVVKNKGDKNFSLGDISDSYAYLVNNTNTLADPFND